MARTLVVAVFTVDQADNCWTPADVAIELDSRFGAAGPEGTTVWTARDFVARVQEDGLQPVLEDVAVESLSREDFNAVRDGAKVLEDFVRMGEA